MSSHVLIAGYGWPYDKGLHEFTLGFDSSRYDRMPLFSEHNHHLRHPCWVLLSISSLAQFAKFLSCLNFRNFSNLLSRETALLL